MASRYEVEVKILSAKDLKNINWRYGGLKPYAVVWIDPKSKSSTKVDAEGDTSPYWDETLVIPFSSPIEDSTLYIDVVHVVSGDEDTKPLIGSAKLHLSEVVDDVGLGERSQRTLQLKRPSGRPQGKIEVKVTVREPRYRPSDSYYAPPYGVPPPGTNRDFSAPPPPQPYAAPYSAPHDPYYSTAPPSGYPYGGYNAPAPYGQSNYGQPSYGQPSYGQPAYGDQVYGHPEEKKSKYGMGTGLAIGAAAGVLGGLALGEGVEYLEDKIAEDAAERVEDDLGYGDDDF
ncbi:hypothetical protein SDJN02_26008, partial [Cucurbita argyrosperma subsp. argyrosperma]|uniref:Protein SRC2-like n=2 Tax=Cucurbita TaxID=3660 RepID=A0A6J1G1Q1_CUCMO